MEILKEIIQQFVEGEAWFNWFTAIVTAASSFAALTPTPQEGTFWAKLYKVIDFLAINVGKAKEKSEE
jgi:hypothetical protein